MAQKCTCSLHNQGKGIRNISQRGIQSTMAHKWADSLQTWALSNASQRGTKLSMAQRQANWLHPVLSWQSPTVWSRGQNQRWPPRGRMGYVCGGSQTLYGGEQTYQWPKRRHFGHIIRVVLNVAKGWEQGTKSAMAYKWANWLHNPWRPVGSPMLHIQGHNHQW